MNINKYIRIILFIILVIVAINRLANINKQHTDPDAQAVAQRVFDPTVEQALEHIQQEGATGSALNDLNRAMQTRINSAAPPPIASLELQPKQDESTGKWGYVDRENKWIIPPQFDRADDFYAPHNVAVVQKGRRWGYIDTNGAWILPTDKASELTAQESGDQLGYVNTQGEWVIPPVFKYIYDFDPQTSLAFVYACLDSQCDQSGWAFIDITGTLTSPLFDRDPHFDEDGMAIVQLAENGKEGVINIRGEWIIPATFDSIEPFLMIMG